MLPLVEDFKKQSEPTTGCSSLVLQTTPDSIFTRFRKKFDPHKDFMPRQQCERQQQPGQTEGGNGVCDLNRSSSSASPASLNVYDSEPAQFSAAITTSPLLLSPFDRMAFNTVGTKNEMASVDDVFRGRSQIAFVTLIRQLSYLTTHADSIFHRLSADVKKISDQSQRLKLRMETLQTYADSILGKKAAKPDSTSLSAYTSVKKHFRSAAKVEVEDKDEGYGLFSPATRSSIILTLYDASDVDPMKKRTRLSSRSVEHCATQTDDTTERSGSTIQSSVHRETTTANAASCDNSGLPVSGTKALERRNSKVSNDYLWPRSQHHVKNNDQNAQSVNGHYSMTESMDDSSLISFPAIPMTGDVGTVIAIDVSGSKSVHSTKAKNSDYGEILHCSARKTAIDKDLPERRRIKCDGHNRCRRNTIAGDEAKCLIPILETTQIDPALAHNGSYQENKIENQAPRFNIETTGDSIANEVVYEFAPFYRRKSKQFLNTTNFFSSLRRPKKDKQITYTPAPCKNVMSNGSSVHIPTKKHDLSGHSNPNVSFSNPKMGGNSALKGIKQLFKRSSSLRRPKYDKCQSPNASELNFDESSYASRPRGQCSLDKGALSMLAFHRKDSSKPKTILPISTTSQVIDLAAQLRDNKPSPLTSDTVVVTDGSQRFSKLSSSSSRDSAYSSCGKKLRPPSVISLTSTDFAESKMNGWYRQGYQLEYPDECVQDTGLSGKPIPSITTPIRKTVAKSAIKPASRDTSNSSPYSESSSFVDSNFSCDREGYFTTMHRDCGLVNRTDGILKTEPASRGQCSLISSPCQSSSSSLNTVTERNSNYGVIGNQTKTPPCNGNHNAQEPKCRPPDLSLQSSIQMATAYPTLTPPMSATSEAEIKFDLWLMSKFHAEQRMQYYMQQQRRCLEMENNTGMPLVEMNRGHNFGRFSLPRCKKENNQASKTRLVEDYLRNLDCNDNQINLQKQDPAISTGLHVTNDHSCTMPRKTVRFCD